MIRTALAAFCLGLFAGACGATDEVAPPQEKPNVQCRSFDELMPRFVASISAGRTENLKQVVEKQLLVSARPDDPPPIADVLRVIFATMHAFASKPPEPGGTKTEYCAPKGSPPPLSVANEVCEVRRTLERFVHEGTGLDSVAVFEPQLKGVADYITGSGSSTDHVPHYEVAAALSNFCANTAQCQLSNGLDLVIAFTDYATTVAGKKLVADLNALGERESLKAFLAPQNLSEDGFVAISRALLPAIAGADPNGLQMAFEQLPLPADLKTDLGPVIDDLKVIVQTPALIEPAKRLINCVTVSDRNSDIARMLYRLAIRDDRDEFGITVLSQVFKRLQDFDQRGSIIYLVNTLAKAVRSDEQAITSAARTCRTLLSTSVPAGQSQSNAQLALPVVAELLRGGIIEESICAIDTLLFGCSSGGAQPACRRP